jgi:hypothetical protein
MLANDLTLTRAVMSMGRRPMIYNDLPRQFVTGK